MKKMTNKQQTISNEVSDGIVNLLGRNTKILYKTLVRTESRGDKVDNRILIVSQYRIFITTNKVPTKIDNSFHLMEIEALDSKKANHLSITLVHEHKPVSLLLGLEDTDEPVRNLIQALVCAYDDLYPDVSIETIINKINLPFELPLPIGVRKTKVCGNFSGQYAAMCDLCQTPFRPEVAWDIDTIYLAHDIRELHLKDFDHLEPRDLIPLVLALSHNKWMEGVIGDGVRGEVWENTWRAARCGLRSIRWRHAQLTQAHALRAASMLRSATVLLSRIDLAHNHIEDKGAIAILTAMSHHKGGMDSVILSQCGITSKTVNHLANILNDNINNVNSLTHLDLSNNNLKDDINNLYTFLAQPNVLKHLNLSNTEITLENIWGAMLRGCAAKLHWLNVSRNVWSLSKRTKEPPRSFREFFTACLALQHLDVSHCKMPADALKNLLLGLACNESLGDMKLCLSGVVTSQTHSHVLDSCIHGVRCLYHIDLADTSMELDLGDIVKAIGRNHSVTHLTLSRLTGKRTYAPPLIQALVQVLQENDTTLTYLDLSDCKLKGDLFSLLNALGGARQLKTLDISGNMICDPGARLLAKALQSNATIETLYIDRNGFSHQGLSDVCGGVRRSVSIKRVEFPATDICGTRNEKAAQAWRELHDSLSEREPRRARLRARALRRPVPTPALAAAGRALPPAPTPAVLDRVATTAHNALHHYIQRCAEIFAACGGSDGPINSELITLQDVKNCLEPAMQNLQDLITDAVESLAIAAYECSESIDSEANDSDLILTPISHSGATPLGYRKRGAVSKSRPKSVAEQTSSSNEMLSLPPMLNEANDELADLPHRPLHHLVKGRPKRAKTRAPSRPITDQSQDLSEGLEEFWRSGEEMSLSRSLRSLRSFRSLRSTPPPDDTLYSLTSGDSTPVLIDAEVSRSQSSDNVDSNKALQRLSLNSPTLPSRSSDNLSKIGNGCVRTPGKARPWSVAGVNSNACTTEGVEACVGGSIVGITPGAALTSSMIRDEPIPTDDVDTQLMNK